MEKEKFQKHVEKITSITRGKKEDGIEIMNDTINGRFDIIWKSLAIRYQRKACSISNSNSE